MPGRRALFILALLLLAVCAWLAGRRERVRNTPAVLATVPEATPGAEVRVAAPSAPARSAMTESPPDRASPEASPVPSETARHFLAEYYGDRWPEIEAKIEAAGESVDVPYRFTPWEQCEGNFAKLVPLDEERFRAAASSNVLWPDKLTAEWLRSRYSVRGDLKLDDEVLAAIDDLASAENSELRPLGDEFATLVNQHLEEMWARGTYLKAPFTTKGISTEKGFYSTSHAGLGWSIVLTLTRDACPDVVEIENQMIALRDSRDDKVIRYLQSTLRR